eukprot:5926276-Prymnesium_polylepis.1
MYSSNPFTHEEDWNHATGCLQQFSRVHVVAAAHAVDRADEVAGNDAAFRPGDKSFGRDA